MERQPVAAGLSAALLGYASSVAVVITGLTAAGASPDEVGSALLALGVARAALSVGLSARTRVPVAVVWTNPGSRCSPRPVRCRAASRPWWEPSC